MRNTKPTRPVIGPLPPTMLTLAIGLSLSLSLTGQAEAQRILAMNSPRPLVGSPNIVGSDTRPVPQRVAANLSVDLIPVSFTTEPFLIVEDNRISVRLENHPLSWVLQEVVTRGHVAITKAEESAATFETIPVTAQFKDLPLDQGLRILLKDVDALYFYRAGRQAAADLQTVWVYPKGQGETMRPVPPSVWDPTRELRANLSHSEPAHRRKALKDLIKHEGANAEPYILEALNDPNDSVRHLAFEGAFRTSIDVPVDVLTDLLQHDALPRIRFLALHALTRDVEANRWLIELVLDDADEKIQEHAKMLLANIDTDDEDNHEHHDE
ncbi:MAG: hypothetical protein GKS05_04280 [Nitrospirales bacterium]|nr:hypothetical protein [Nitrospirales bacterium]